MTTLIDILRTCNDYYSNTGDYYVFDEEDKQILQEYDIDAEVSTDDVYDTIYDIAKKNYPNDVFFLATGSEVRGDKVKLPIPLGSMTECKEDELMVWLKPNTDYMVSAKLDGCSCLACYENGQLKIAYSRGDGTLGQDITRIVKTFEHSVQSLKNPDNVMIRGEIIVPKQDIPTMIEELYNETKKRYKNGRNTVAGQLNSKACAKAFSKYARFIAYKIIDFNGSETEMFKTLEDYGLEVAKHWWANTEFVNIDVAKAFVQEVKNNYDYECDGVIFTVDNKSDEFEGFETSTFNPKESRKFKIGAVVNSAETEVEYVEWNVSKNCLLKPRVKIKPVDLNGVTIDWATGHNYGNIVNNKIGKDAKVIITRRGDVIPYIEKVIEPCVESGLATLNLPEDGWFVNESGVDAEYCYGCNEKFDEEVCLQKLVYFCEKLGVKYAGEGNLKLVMFITGNPHMNFYNLINLPVTVFNNAIGINGMKLYASLHECLKKATVAQLMDATGAFGAGIGELKLNKIIEAYGELPFDKNKILQVEGWSEISAEQYMASYAAYISYCDVFIKSGIELKFSAVEKVSNDLEGLFVCFTGIRDKEMEMNIVSRGGKIVSSVTKACNLLITKEANSLSGKAKKARENGVEILPYDEAVKRFK